MSNLPLVEARSAREVCAHFYLPLEVLQQTRGGISPRQFVDALMEKKQYLVGIDFVAHAIPAREAIWWGCLCLQHACGERLAPPEKAACKAAVLWVLQPSEENRVMAQAEADAVGVTSPAGALAGAAAQTGGSVAPPDRFAPAKLVAMSVQVAATKGDPAKMAQNHRLFLGLGIQIAEGLYLRTLTFQEQ